MAGIVVRQRSGATRTLRLAALRSRLNGGHYHHFLSFAAALTAG